MFAILRKGFCIATYKMSKINYYFVDKQSQNAVHNSIVLFHHIMLRYLFTSWQSVALLGLSDPGTFDI